jgi:hypothetical protein
MQGDDRSMARIEAPERNFQELALCERARVVGHIGGVDRRQFDLHRTATSTAEEVETGVDRQTMQPGIESVGVTKPGQVAPGADEAFLHSILCQVRIANDQPRGSVQPPEGAIYELGKGVMVASPRPFDEHSLIHGPLGSGTPDPVALLEYGVDI